MPSDVERIAEVLARHFEWDVDPRDLEVVKCKGCDWSRRVPYDGDDADMRYREHLAEQLEAASFGHVPTALHQAADDWQRGDWADAPRYADRVPDRLSAAQYVVTWLRARADQAGGTA